MAVNRHNVRDDDQLSNILWQRDQRSAFQQNTVSWTLHTSPGHTLSNCSTGTLLSSTVEPLLIHTPPLQLWAMGYERIWAFKGELKIDQKKYCLFTTGVISNMGHPQSLRPLWPHLMCKLNEAKTVATLCAIRSLTSPAYSWNPLNPYPSVPILGYGLSGFMGLENLLIMT